MVCYGQTTLTIKTVTSVFGLIYRYRESFGCRHIEETDRHQAHCPIISQGESAEGLCPPWNANSQQNSTRGPLTTNVVEIFWKLFMIGLYPYFQPEIIGNLLLFSATLFFLYKKLEYPHSLKNFLDFAHFQPKMFLSSFLFLVKIRNSRLEWAKLS